MKNKIVTLIVFVVVVALAGGAFLIMDSDGDNNENEATNNSSTTNQVQEQPDADELGQSDIDEAIKAYESWSKAFFAGDTNTACELVTENYTNEVAEQDDSPDDCEGQVTEGSAIAKAFGIDASEFTSTGSIKGSTIIVTSGKEGLGSDSFEMVQENGKWKVNSEIQVVSEEEQEQDMYKTTVEEWNNLSQAERDSWYNEDGTGGFDSYAESKGVETE